MAIAQAKSIFSDDFQEAVSQIVTEDSLKLLEEQTRRQQETLDSTMLADRKKITNKMTSTLSAIDSMALKVERQEDKAAVWSDKQPDLYEDVASSLENYDTFKAESQIDDLELKYEQLKLKNTLPQSGEYRLANYELYVSRDDKWNRLYNEILPTGMDRVNPWFTSDPEKLAEFREYDLEKRQEFLAKNEQMDDMYDALITGEGDPNDEYQKLLELRKSAMGAIENYNESAPKPEDRLDINNVLTQIKAENIGIETIVDELHTSKNIDTLIDELRQTEYNARKSRVPVNLLPVSIPGRVGGPTIETYQESGADASFRAASDLDPNLFSTFQGLVTKGWDDVTGGKHWIDPSLEDPQVFVRYLLENQIDPTLFGFMPDDPAFKELLVDMYKDASIDEQRQELDINPSPINVNKYY